ncbi:unnamed protein product [Mytilus coruscus]|uniref:B box-type domain-containing protein n=1 Tax=Mytilus coruscus TaxID=42192 RepID=A0A6J8DN06_MYTCO|nr:unnamed protein product [Mytilus coruscus]
MAYSQLPHDAQIPVGCGLCEGRNRIQWKCIDCSLLMCTRCKDVVHPKFKNATSHKVVDIKELGSDESKGKVNFQDRKCKEHTTQICGFYCKDCKQFICGKCITNAHRGHDAVDDEEYENEMIMLLASQKEAERKFKKLTLSNPGTASPCTGSTKMAEVRKPEIKSIRQFPTEFTHISKVLSSSDDSAWIVHSSAKLMQHVKLTKGSIQVLSEFKMHVGDMAYMSKNEIFLSVGGTPWLELLDERIGIISVTYYNFKPLWTRGIHVTRDQKIIVGAVTPGLAITFSRRRLVIVMDMDGNVLRQYESDCNKKQLFTFPYRITSTSNGNIWVVDKLATSGRGRVIVLGQTAGVIQIYNGHPDVNSQSKPFTPTGILTTPADNVVVADSACNTLHILNCDGKFMTYIRTDGIGIRYPYSLAMSRPGHFIIGCASTGSMKANLYQLQYSGF